MAASDSSPSSLPPARGQAKAEAVLDAARALFVEHGFGATSMDAIAARAGVSKATVYAHHGGKHALFAATTQRACEHVTERMALPAEVADMPLESALRALAHSFLEAILAPQNLTLFRMVIAEQPRFPELGRIFYDSAPGRTRERVRAYLERARRHGLLESIDCELAAAQFLGALRGDLQIQALLGVGPQTIDAPAVVDAAVATFLRRYARVTPAPGGR